MPAVTLERSVLFADIAGSTRLVVEQGDETARLFLVRYVGLLADAARAGGGEVANVLGDEVFCIFPTADDAAAAAAAMHEAVEAASARERQPRPVRIRVGFEHGSLVHSEEGWFGNTVHRAARLVALAKGGQTLTTRVTLDRLGPRWRESARFFDRSVLRGGSGEEELHELLWDASFTSVLRTPLVEPAADATIAVELSCGERELRVDAARPRVELGRDPACDLHVAASGVSRLHAVIAWNRGRASLTDRSTNGTILQRAGHGTQRVHHDTVTLEGEGTLWLGAAQGGVPPVTYRCVGAA